MVGVDYWFNMCWIIGIIYIWCNGGFMWIIVGQIDMIVDGCELDLYVLWMLLMCSKLCLSVNNLLQCDLLFGQELWDVLGW